jgi:flagella basal body P-ring formation protein FlgA
MPVPWLLAAALTGLAGAAPAATVDPDVVRDALETAWSGRATPGLHLEIRHLPELVHHDGVPQVEPLLPDGPLRAGPRAIPVNLRVDGRIVARGLANIVVHERLTVWVPIRPIPRGATVTVADLRPEPRTRDREAVRLLEDPGVGAWIAARDLEEGRDLRASDLDRKPDVAAGDEILLVSRAGDASVSVAGRVRRSGSVGETILVLNPVTGSIVRAVLVDPATAELIGPGNPGGRSAS